MATMVAVLCFVLILLGISNGFLSSKDPEVKFFEDFEGGNWKDKWIPSQAQKIVSSQKVSQYDGQWNVESSTKYPLPEKNLGLVMKSARKHHAISSKLDEAFIPSGEKDFVIQYEMKAQNSLTCGGAYIKLLEASDSFEPEDFNDKTSFSIMFGPDRCIPSNKVHFIIRYKDHKTGKIEEKAMTTPPAGIFDELTNIYTLIVKPDLSFKILVNLVVLRSGNLLYDFEPPINPPKEIDDPTDKKPSDWVDLSKIPDMSAKKPEDWNEDEPEFISDSTAQKPEDWLDNEPFMIPDSMAQKPQDWDDEEDGEWIPPLVSNPLCSTKKCGEWKQPLIKNPKYKGKWIRPMIDNPIYVGEWKPRKIPNPNYYYDAHPNKFIPIGAVGFEVWTMNDGIFFDNILITESEEIALSFAKKTWVLKHEQEQLLKSIETGKKKFSWKTFFEDMVRDIFELIRRYIIGITSDPYKTIINQPLLTLLLMVLPSLVFAIFYLVFIPTQPKRSQKTNKQNVNESKEKTQPQDKQEEIENDK